MSEDLFEFREVRIPTIQIQTLKELETISGKTFKNIEKINPLTHMSFVVKKTELKS